MRYQARKPPAASVAASLAMQMPAPSPESVPVPGPTGAAEGTPGGSGASGDDERGRLLRRIAGARVAHLDLALAVIEAEGLGSFTTEALKRMVAVLDVVEDRENG